MGEVEEVTDTILAEAIATAETMVETALSSENIATTDRDKAMVQMGMSAGFTGALEALHRHGWLKVPDA